MMFARSSSAQEREGDTSTGFNPNATFYTGIMCDLGRPMGNIRCEVVYVRRYFFSVIAPLQRTKD